MKSKNVVYAKWVAGLALGLLAGGAGAAERRMFIDSLGQREHGAETFQLSALPVQTIITGDFPRSIATGDFNGDGHADIVTRGITVSVLLGKGDGSFQDRVDYTVPGISYSITAADLNGDGFTDLATPRHLTSGESRYQVAVLLGRGDGSFSSPVYYPTGDEPWPVIAVDLTGDGHPDLATGNMGDKTISVLPGLGDGSFGPKVNYAVSGNPSALTTADLNGDGRVDLAAAANYPPGVSVLLNHGDGTFKTAVDYSAGRYPVKIAAGDLNGDGVPDLATCNQNTGSDTISVLLGQAGGTFQSKVDYIAGRTVDGILFADFDGDGHQDIATANYNGLSVSVFLGQGDGTFLAKMDFNAGNGPYDLAIADLDGDGRLDLVTANNDGTISALLNRLNPSLDQPSPFANQIINTTSPPQVITLTNPGTTPLVFRSGDFKLAAFAISGDFAVASDTCGDSLAAGGTCTVNVTFTPTALGLRTGQLFVDGAADNSTTGPVTLSGTGISPPFTTTADLALKLTAPKTAKKGKSLVYYSLTASNGSKANAPDVLLKGTLDSGATYSKLPAFCGATGQNLTCQLGTLNGKKQKTFTISVKPSAVGTLGFNASFSGDINDPNPANNAAAVSTKVK